MNGCCSSSLHITQAKCGYWLALGKKSTQKQIDIKDVITATH
jgi:hypothetical protein